MYEYFICTVVGNLSDLRTYYIYICTMCAQAQADAIGEQQKRRQSTIDQLKRAKRKLLCNGRGSGACQLGNVRTHSCLKLERTAWSDQLSTEEHDPAR